MLVVALLAGLPASAQFSGRVTGSVVDASGAVIAGADVELYLAGGRKPLRPITQLLISVAIIVLAVAATIFLFKYPQKLGPIFITALLKGEQPVVYGDGNQTRDYVFIDDVVHALALAAERASGKLVNIGTGVETSVNALYKALAEIVGFQGEAGNGPLPPGELRRISLDIKLAQSALGWHPWTHLEDGLAETVSFLRGL